MEEKRNFLKELDLSPENENVVADIQNLRKQGLKFDDVNEDGDNLLMLAIKNENVAAFNEILKYDQNLDIQNDWNRTPLHRAALVNNTYMVSELLKRKANPNIQDKDGMLAVMFATINDNMTMVVSFQSVGADLSIKDYVLKLTTLEWASKLKSKKALFALRNPQIALRTIQKNAGRC